MPVADPMMGDRGHIFYGLSHPQEFGEHLRMHDLPIEHAHMPMLKEYYPSSYISAFNRTFGHPPADASAAQQERDVRRRKRRERQARQ